MPVTLYIPDSNKVIHRTEVDFIQRDVQQIIHIVQYDKSLPIIAVKLYNDGVPYTLPQYTDVNIRWGKRDRTFVYDSALGCNEDRTVVYFKVSPQMTTSYGENNPIIELINSGSIAGSSPIPFYIDINPIQEDYIESNIEVGVLDSIRDDIIELFEKLPTSGTNTTYEFSTGTENGTFKVTPSDGITKTILVYGLGSAAFTNSTNYRLSSWNPFWVDVINKPSTFPAIIGTGASDAAAGNHTHPYAALSHNHTGIYEPVITKGTTSQYFRGDMSLATMPTTLPASDVYAWAKASVKPTYTSSEVGAASSSHMHSGVYEPVITKGTTSQYFRGDMSLATMPTTLPASDVYAWAKASVKPTYTFSEIQTKPTTISGYGISDALSTSHAASVVTAAKISNWDTAYSWGNHAGLYRADTWVPNASDISSLDSTHRWLTDSYISTWNAKSDAHTHPYLSNTHDASAVTTVKISNWDAAYSWGNHAGLYRLSNWVPFASDIAGLDITHRWLTDSYISAWNAKSEAHTHPYRSNTWVPSFTDVTGTASSSQIPNLDASKITTGTIDIARLPAITITDRFVYSVMEDFEIEYASNHNLLQKGDVVILTGDKQTYIHNGGVTWTSADLTLLQTPTDIVTSVAGKIGIVTLVKADVGLGNVDNTADVNKSVSYAASAGSVTWANVSGKIGSVYGSTAGTFAEGNHTHAGVYEPTFTKNTAFNKNFEASTSNIKMNGSVSVGALTTVARADHIHPIDTSRAADSVVVKLSGDQTIAGAKTFSSTIVGSINGNAATASNADKIDGADLEIILSEASDAKVPSSKAVATFVDSKAVKIIRLA